METRQKKIWILPEFVASKELKAAHKLLLGVLSSNSSEDRRKGKKGWRVSNHTSMGFLCDMIGMSYRQTERLVSELIKMGLVEKISGGFAVSEGFPPTAGSESTSADTSTDNSSDQVDDYDPDDHVFGGCRTTKDINEMLSKGMDISLVDVRRAFEITKPMSCNARVYEIMIKIEDAIKANPGKCDENFKFHFGSKKT